ncbi:MAG: DUF4268 domain-containing protein [Clostridiales bacterium]|nr:DUF4268 domain-containing protein [Clostridiales bacterium]
MNPGSCANDFRPKDFATIAGLKFDWRELPEKKASRIVIEKSVNLDAQDEWNLQFDWAMDVCLKVKKAFKKYL